MTGRRGAFGLPPDSGTPTEPRLAEAAGPRRAGFEPRDSAHHTAGRAKRLRPSRFAEIDSVWAWVTVDDLK